MKEPGAEEARRPSAAMELLRGLRGVLARNLQVAEEEGQQQERGAEGDTYLSLHLVGEDGEIDDKPVYIGGGRVERCNPSWLDIELGWGGGNGGGGLLEAGGGVRGEGGAVRGAEFGVRLWRCTGGEGAIPILGGGAARGKFFGSCGLASSALPLFTSRLDTCLFSLPLPSSLSLNMASPPAHLLRTHLHVHPSMTR